MKPEELRADIQLELRLMGETVRELTALARDVAGRAPTVREKSAAGAFLAQLYSGVENILKRVCQFYNVELPSGGDWHRELLERFGEPPQAPLPSLLGGGLAGALEPYRRFRHIVYHSYGLQLKWERMQPGLDQAEAVFARFRTSMLDFVEKINESPG